VAQIHPHPASKENSSSETEGSPRSQPILKDHR
jgi:hypothetical protein